MPEILINIDDNTYRKIKEQAAIKGYSSIERYIEHILRTHVEAPTIESTQQKDIGRLIDKYVAKIERKIMDIINPYTSKMDEAKREIASLYEAIESIKEKISDIEGKIKELEEHQQPRARQQYPEKRKTAIEILREQKVFYESLLSNRIRNRDTFFRKLENEGAVILNIEGERVAIDPEFWRIFTEKIDSIWSSSDAAIKKVLSSRQEQELFEKLRKANMIIYDNSLKKWIILVDK